MRTDYAPKPFLANQRPEREIAPFLAWASWGVVVAPVAMVAAMLWGGPVVKWALRMVGLL